MRMPPLLAAAVLVTLSAASPAAAPAQSQERSENLVSELRTVRPEAPGLKLAVEEGDRFLRLTNETGDVVVVEGYDDEPYLRFLPGRAVEVNTRSPSRYDNADRYGQRPVPPEADADAGPRWQRVADGSSYRWFDHRIHVMTPGTPEEVTDESRRTKIFDWRVPIRVGGRPVAALGTLTWEPDGDSSSGPSTVLIVAIVAAAAALVAVLLLLVMRRRRPPGAGRDRPVEEAW